MEACDYAYRGHAVCIPCPFQSHIKGMLKLAKILHHKGFHITFVNTEFNHRRYLKSRSSSPEHNSNLADGLPNFHFETIPDGLQAPSNENANQDANSLFESITNNIMLQPFLDLLQKLNSSSNSVSCIISDGFMPFTVTAAQQLGIPIALFYTIAACSFKGCMQLRTLEENTTLASLIDLDSYVIRVATEAAKNAAKASAVVIHTFDSLEGQVLDALSAMFPNLFTVGPLQLLLNRINEKGGNSLSSVGYKYNLWKEETECLQWLDSKQLPKSVMYVNFGSSIYLKKQQLIEVAMGLVNSNHPFLWIIRPDLVTGEVSDLPSEFEVKAKEKGFIARWCPQEEVLNHPAIGGFFTHSGWNSTIESICAGVPMICWPFLGDQTTNCKYTCNEWGVGLEIINSGDDNQVIRNVVENLVRELMEGEKGKQMRNKASEWKRLAEEAAAPDGSSATNLEKLVNQVLLSKGLIPSKN